MNTNLRNRLTWRLRVMMAERNISSATELQRQLHDSGYEITSSQLTRTIKERPERISTDLLDHLLEILDCDISDLLRKDPTLSNGNLVSAEDQNLHRKVQNKKPRVRREVPKPDENLTGPKVTPFPMPKK
ncbi:MAG: hypothetical protein CTY13_00335 [Methylobacter sp.]|nr:MAG: hypothetical protein CTY13_00335 [Methylobacter sp.]